MTSLWPFAPVEAMPLEMLKRLEEEELRAAKGLPKVTDARPTDLEAPAVRSVSETNAIEVARQLRSGGAMFYGTFWCPACDAQRQLFGMPAWQSVPYVECDARNARGEPKRCVEAGVDAIPFWTFADGSTHSGVMSVSDLEARVNPKSTRGGVSNSRPTKSSVQLPMPSTSDCEDCKIGEGAKNSIPSAAQ
eukprot:symbB.v1.2.001884.t1/scaffold79.1/size344139/15